MVVGNTTYLVVPWTPQLNDGQTSMMNPTRQWTKLLQQRRSTIEIRLLRFDSSTLSSSSATSANACNRYECSFEWKEAARPSYNAFTL